MKALITISTLVATLAFAAAAAAGEGAGCHFHGSKPATEGVVKDCAEQRRNVLIQGGKLDTSWKASRQEAVELVDGKKGKEWKVRYSNPAAADKAKQTLFIFFSHSGNFIAANFTGE